MESEIIKWIATAFLTVSGVLVSFSVKWATEWWPYAGFLIGHIIWSIFSITMNEWALLAMNVVFIFIDIYAIYIRLITINNPIGEENG